MQTVETPNFASTTALVRWMKHAMKMDRYNKVATKVTFIFGDGITREATPKRNAKQAEKPGTIAANFSFMIRTLTCGMTHSSDNALAEEIDQRGGVMFVYEVVE